MSEINIQCPECEKRFLVSPELMGKTSQCRHCDTAFELSPANVKPHPVRHKTRSGNERLNKFTRSTPDFTKNEAPSVRTTAYHRQVDVTAVMPLGPARVLAIFAGVSIAGVIGLVFVLGNGEQGMLTDVGSSRRWVLVGFTALISTLLMVYGFRKYKAVGYGLTLLSVASLLTLPVIYPEKKPTGETHQQVNTLSDTAELSQQQALDLYRRELGYASVQARIDASAEPELLVAIALKGAKPVHLDLIKSYLSQSLGSELRPNEYKGRRIAGVDTTLLIYQRVTLPLAEFAQLMEKFSHNVQIRPELQLIEVAVDLDALTVNNREALSDPSHTSFYEANLAELNSFDRSRQLQAILRLSKSPGLRMRADIEQRLLTLLQQPRYPHREQVIQLLVNWGSVSDSSSEIISQQALDLIAANEEVPLSTIEYCVLNDCEHSVRILLEAWKRERVVHEKTLISVGARIEPALLAELESLEPVQLESAGNVLRHIGSENSLTLLLTLHESSSGSVRKSLKAAIDEIQSRL